MISTIAITKHKTLLVNALRLLQEEMFGAEKVAIITGAANGIGKATAEELLKKGAKVCLADMSEVDGKETLKEFIKSYGAKHVMFIKCDIRSAIEFENAFKQTISAFGHINILINNAGIFNPDQWENIIDINVKGTIRGTKLGFQYMGIDNGGKGGVIINVGSTSGLYAVPPIPEYSSSKHAIVGFTRCVGSKDYLDKHGVRVNVICPGGVQTDMTKVADSLGLTLKNYQYLKPEVVAKNILMLIEDTSRNGAILQLREQAIGDYIQPEISILESAAKS